MAIINFSVGDILRNKLLEPKWYSFQITKVDGPKPNSKKDGFNFDVVFTLIDAGELDGKEIPRTFSNKAMSMMLPLVAAIRGIDLTTMNKEAFEFDTEELLNKKVDGMVETDTYNGNMKNVVDTYMPYKSASNVPKF